MTQTGEAVAFSLKKRGIEKANHFLLLFIDLFVDFHFLHHFDFLDLISFCFSNQSAPYALCAFLL